MDLLTITAKLLTAARTIGGRLKPPFLAAVRRDPRTTFLLSCIWLAGIAAGVAWALNEKLLAELLSTVIAAIIALLFFIIGEKGQDYFDKIGKRKK